MECQGALGSVLKTKVAIEASLKVVNVVGILDQKHGSTTVMVNGRKEKRCSIVPAMTCAEHFEIADYAFKNGWPSSTGQVFVNVFNSSGKRPNKPVGNPGGEGYVKIVEDALAKGDGTTTIAKPEYDACMERLNAAKVARERKELRRAIDILLKAAQNPIPRLANLADDRVREIDEEGAAHVGEAERMLSENEAKAKESLKRIVEKYSPLECSKKAVEILKKLAEKAK